MAEESVFSYIVCTSNGIYAMQIGIVGLPFCGKSTLFQTITKVHLDASALSKTEAHHAIVKVPDARLDKLSALFSPKSTVFATIEFVDVVGLKKGETGSPQFNANFLSSVKTNDALVQVVRLFTNDAVPHPEGSIDALRDISTFETEFILSDLSIIETRMDRIKKQLQKTPDKNLERELPVLDKCRGILEEGKPLREQALSKDEMQILKTYQFLSLKPMLIALNFDETQRSESADIVVNISAKREAINTKIVSFFGRIEMEMSELPESELQPFMDEYGIKESALNAIIRESYALLGLLSYFTVGEDECRAWTIKSGMNAQEAAGVIHTDLASKFIRAEGVSYEHCLAAGGSFAKAKESGSWRLEGKEYTVKDGDILTIRHS